MFSYYRMCSLTIVVAQVCAKNDLVQSVHRSLFLSISAPSFSLSPLLFTHRLSKDRSLSLSSSLRSSLSLPLFLSLRPPHYLSSSLSLSLSLRSFLSVSLSPSLSPLLFTNGPCNDRSSQTAAVRAAPARRCASAGVVFRV